MSEGRRIRKTAEGYERLPGRASGLAGVGRLWLADDHLLLTQTGYSERYRRFFFRDIEALFVRPSRRFAVVGVALFVLAAFPALALGLGWPGRTFWLVALGVELAGLIVHLVRGPTVACHLRTPLSTVRLRSLGRRRRARAVVDRLRERIEQAQGRMSAEQLATLRARAASEPEPPAPVVRQPPPLPSVATGSPPRSHSYGGRIHLLLFGALLLEGVVSAVQVGHDSTPLDTGASLLYVVEVGLAIAAVVLQRRGRLTPGLERITWSSLIALLLLVAVGWVVEVVALVSSLEVMPGPFPTAFQELSWLAALSAIVLAPHGVVGLFLLARWRASRPSPTAQPSAS